MLIKIVGICEAFFPRWYYDASKGVCLQFVYGGCKGNANNFRTLSDCQNVCVRRRGQSVGKLSIFIAVSNTLNSFYTYPSPTHPPSSILFQTILNYLNYAISW